MSGMDGLRGRNGFPGLDVSLADICSKGIFPLCHRYMVLVKGFPLMSSLHGISKGISPYVIVIQASSPE